MSLQAILDAIQAGGDQQVAELTVNAQAQAGDLMLKARTEAARLREETRRTALAPATSDCTRVKQQAQFEASRIVTEAREALINTTLQRARDRLVEMRLEPSYPSLLRRLVQEALADLRRSLPEQEEIVLEADPRDRTVLERLLSGLSGVELDLRVNYALTCWGGVIASSDDGRIVVINTLEARLERAMPYLRRTLASQLDAESPRAGLSQLAATSGA